MNCNHPGGVQTDIFRYTPSFFTPVLNCFLTKPEDGALTQLYLATSPEVEEKNIKGQYYVSEKIYI